MMYICVYIYILIVTAFACSWSKRDSRQPLDSHFSSHRVKWGHCLMFTAELLMVLNNKLVVLHLMFSNYPPFWKNGEHCLRFAQWMQYSPNHCSWGGWWKQWAWIVDSELSVTWALWFIFYLVLRVQLNLASCYCKGCFHRSFVSYLTLFFGGKFKIQEKPTSSSTKPEGSRGLKDKELLLSLLWVASFSQMLCSGLCFHALSCLSNQIPACVWTKKS